MKKIILDLLGKWKHLFIYHSKSSNGSSNLWNSIFENPLVTVWSLNYSLYLLILNENSFKQLFICNLAVTNFHLVGSLSNILWTPSYFKSV